MANKITFGNGQNLNTIMRAYLAEEPIDITKKNSVSYFEKLPIELGTNFRQVALSLNLDDHFFGDYSKRKLARADKWLTPDTLLKFTDKVPNEKLPEGFALDHQGFLNLSLIANGNASVGVIKNIQQNGIEAILKKNQKSLLPEKTLLEREKIGLQAYRDAVDFYGLSQLMMVKLTDTGNKLLFARYYTGERAFNNLERMKDPSIPRTIAAALFLGHEKQEYNEQGEPLPRKLKQLAFDKEADKNLTPEEMAAKKLANAFANVFVGIKKYYEKDELFKAVVNREIPIHQAMFIARYQAGETRTEFAKNIAMNEEVYARNENQGKDPFLKDCVKNFGRIYLGITNEEKLDRLLNTKAYNAEGYDTKILQKLENGLTEFKKGNNISEGNLHIMTAIETLIKNRAVSEEYMKQMTSSGFGIAGIKQLRTTGTLPDHISEENKRVYLAPFALVLGVPDNQKNKFADLVYDWSEEIKYSNKKKDSYNQSLKDLKDYFDSKNPARKNFVTAPKKLVSLISQLETYRKITPSTFASGIAAGDFVSGNDMTMFKTFGIANKTIDLKKCVDLLFDEADRPEMLKAFTEHSNRMSLRMKYGGSNNKLKDGLYTGRED